ncbi:sulfite exporter TauE/SafE family protein [Thiomicrorhabdus sp. ZW0627]|uniref:sulfite exporter TauE/SafE family protein n=1 Tax=Thiomicrorhabdus sp. ZW0627 TaxID=3039774 RepID=UPI0024370F33|nr:sulfite exporter TauE/SafE family protein [Thiomicrorhabdus sp. ZW0627]MDG6774875.1 sulfite exporter TauE/SafE family protein [Thiomicrorhabdus sp. ZW0627]
MNELLILLPILLVSGIVAGLLAGLLGVGGGIVIVPMLYHIFLYLKIDVAIAMPLAIGTSLSTIVVTSIMSAKAHHKKGGIDWRLAKRWLPFVLFGVLIGAVSTNFMHGLTLKVMFGVLLVLVSVHMLASSYREISLAESLPGKKVQSLFATMLGAFSSMLGIGGGTLMVPLLTLFSYPIHQAVATASLFGLIISVPATIGYIVSGWGVGALPIGSTGYVNWLGFIALVPMTMIFAPIGAKLAYRLNVKQLKTAFAIFLALVGLKMLLI